MLSKSLTGSFRVVAAARDAVRAAGDKSKKLQAAIKARDDEIERLEEVLAEEKAKIADLKSVAKQAEFQNEVLETSYAKQLEEARARADEAEQTVADQQAQLTEFEKANHMLTRELDSARARLDMICPDDGATIDELLTSFAKPKTQTIAADKDSQVELAAEPQGSAARRRQAG